MKPDVKIPSCGGFVTPAKFCNTKSPIKSGSLVEGPVIACCAAIVLVPLIEQGSSSFIAWIGKTSSLLPEGMANYLPRTKQHKPGTMPNLKASIEAKVHHFLHLAAETVLASCASIMFAWLVTPNAFVTSVYDLAWWYPASFTTTEWTFGQLIAITIWAPSIIEYIYSAICKSINHSDLNAG